MVRQTVLKTAGGKTLAGSTPVPSVKCGVPGCEPDEDNCCLHHCWTCFSSPHCQSHYMPDYQIKDCAKRVKLLGRENANGKRSDC